MFPENKFRTKKSSTVFFCYLVVKLLLINIDNKEELEVISRQYEQFELSFKLKALASSENRATLDSSESILEAFGWKHDVTVLQAGECNPCIK